MNILVVGCGRVGCQLVGQLEELGHEVSVIDESAQNIEKLQEIRNLHIGGMTVIGVPIDIDVLRSAGIEDCDALVAVTSDDNINIMVAQVAENIFHVPKIIARVTDPTRKQVFTQRFNMHAICSTNLTVHAMLAGILSAESPEGHSVSFGASTAHFIAVPVEPAYVGTKFSNVVAPHSGMLKFGILRANGSMELASATEMIIHKGDKIIYGQISD